MKKQLYTLVMAMAFAAGYAQSSLQFWRSYDQRDLNVFENTKKDTGLFEGIKVRVGGAFTQQFQALEHSNTAAVLLDANGINRNKLIEIGPGFNRATANLNLDVQLEDGIRLNLITYLSSRHHPESWVKGGYIQIDRMVFLNSEFINRLMNVITLRIGHYEINYGDAHFRRTDNGHAFYNPFIESYIMDAFTTEVSGEVIFQKHGWLAVAAVTNGEIQGAVTNPKRRNPAFIGKLGYDGSLNRSLRFRLTSSVYTTPGSVNNTLYGGDRAGSRYFLVMENSMASVSSNAFSGRLNPGFNQMVTAVVINPFIKLWGLELFGNFERASGKSSNESASRTMDQIGADVVIRFGKNEQFFIAGRYNKVNGDLQGANKNIVIERGQAGGGWFITKNILTKFELMQQVYQNFNATDIRRGGKFSGFMLEGCVAF
jgi:hypothetical protein